MSNDPNRPDGDAERLVRIETRLVKYQQANALVQEELVKALQRLDNNLTHATNILEEMNNGKA